MIDSVICAFMVIVRYRPSEPQCWTTQQLGLGAPCTRPRDAKQAIENNLQLLAATDRLFGNRRIAVTCRCIVSRSLSFYQPA